MLGALVVLGVLCAWPLPSARAAGSDRVVGVYVEGPDASKHREQIIGLMPKGVEAADEGEFKKAMRGSGMPAQLGYSLVNKAARKQIVRMLRKAIDKAVLDAAVVARVSRGRKGLEMIVLMLEAGAEEPKVDESVSLAGNSDKQKAALAGALGPAFEALAPPPPEPVAPPPDETGLGDEEDKDKEKEEEKKEGEVGANHPGWELFALHLGLELGGRWLAYSKSDYNSQNTRPYEVFGVPALAVGGEVYPAATTDIMVLEDIGIALAYCHFFGLSSQTADQRVFGTNWNRFDIALRLRHTFGKPDGYPVTLALSGDFGFQNFTFEPNDARAKEIAAEVADVAYRYMKLGLDARFNLGRLGIMPRLAYVGPLQGGGLYDRFRGDSIRGVELGLDLAVVAAMGIEVRGGVGYTQFGSSFQPEPGDAYVAGGALDKLLGVQLGAAYVY